MSYKSDTYLWFLFSLILIPFLIFILYGDFRPYWETNDDIAMSMVAHGYGLSEKASPYLVFSNIIWGLIVSAVPEVRGVSGYSIATIGTMALVSVVLFNAIFKQSKGLILTIGILCLLMLRPLLFPQFTINSGLLFVSAISCFWLYTKKPKAIYLLLSCVLFFLSFITRSHEFILLLIISVPVIPWKNLLNDKPPQYAVSVVTICILAAIVIDHMAYQTKEWDAFKNLNTVRAFYTDFGFGKAVIQDHEILAHYNFTENDIKLIRNWFFVDTDIADPNVLASMVRDIGSVSEPEKAINRALNGFGVLLSSSLIYLSLCAFFLFIIFPSWRVAISWLIFLSVVFFIGFFGRPGIERIYYPVLGLLCVSTLIFNHLSGVRYWLAVTVVCLLVFFNSQQVLSDSRTMNSTAEQAREALSKITENTFAVWGSVFPYEEIYPVLDSPQIRARFQFYSFGVFTLAPFTFSYSQENSGNGFVRSLLSNSGIKIVLDQSRMELLDQYCKEHLRGKLNIHSKHDYGQMVIRQVQCEADQ